MARHEGVTVGFLSDLKNSITGGWADVSVSAGTGSRGGPLDVAVDVSVRSSDVAVDEVYVVLECREIVEIDNVPVQVRGGDGAPETEHVDVAERETLFDRRLSLARPRSLEAGSQHRFEGTIDLPAHLPPSYAGRNARIEWRVHAGLDTKGNDPDSGWQRIQVH